jgi:hypothetical protein
LDNRPHGGRVTKRAAYTQADIERTVRALRAAGEMVTGVEHVPGGGFRVLTAQGEPAKPVSPYEAWEREHGDRAA